MIGTERKAALSVYRVGSQFASGKRPFREFFRDIFASSPE